MQNNNYINNQELFIRKLKNLKPFKAKLFEFFLEETNERKYSWKNNFN